MHELSGEQQIRVTRMEFNAYSEFSNDVLYVSWCCVKCKSLSHYAYYSNIRSTDGDAPVSVVGTSDGCTCDCRDSKMLGVCRVSDLKT